MRVNAGPREAGVKESVSSANEGAWPAARPLLLNRCNPGMCGYTDISGQVCCRHQTLTAAVFVSSVALGAC